VKENELLLCLVREMSCGHCRLKRTRVAMASILWLSPGLDLHKISVVRIFSGLNPHEN